MQDIEQELVGDRVATFLGLTQSLVGADDQVGIKNFRVERALV
jgi:hypothetical protein